MSRSTSNADRERRREVKADRRERQRIGRENMLQRDLKNARIYSHQQTVINHETIVIQAVMEALNA